MKKYWIIYYAVVIPLCGLLVMLYVIRLNNLRRTQATINQVFALATGLSQSNSSPLLVDVRSELQTNISEFVGTNGGTAYASLRDVSKPSSPGIATHCLYIENSRSELVGLRLHYDLKIHKFRLLSVWRPTSVPESASSHAHLP